jgi:NTE family protein
MVGGVYAAGIPIRKIEQEWLSTSLPKVARSFLPTFPRAGLSSGGGVRKYLKDLLGDVRIEDLTIPFAATGCDIDTGKAVILDRGPLVDAIRASVSIPGLFQPVRWENHLLVDGGLVEPLPVRLCRDLGADIVIGVDIMPACYPTTVERRRLWNRLGESIKVRTTTKTWIPSNLSELLNDIFKEQKKEDRPLPGVYSVINQAVVILQQEIMRLKLSLWPADLLVRPELPRGLNYLRATEGIHAGEEVMRKALPELRLLIESKALKRGSQQSL